MASKTDIFNGRWVDLIFAGRNQAYGAFVLRKKGDEYTIKGIVFAIVLFTASVSAPVILNYIESKLPKENVVKVDDVTTLEEPPPIDKNEPPPPPPAEPPPPLKSTVKFTPPEIKPDEDVPDDEPPPIQEEMKDKDAGTTTVEGDPNGVDASLTEGGEGDGEAEILTFAEQMPDFPGGVEELYRYLGKNIQYPPLARENSIEGKVVLTFVVDKDGKISNIESAGKKLGWGCDEEAIRVVKSMPAWTPGKQNGKPVIVKYTLPIRFQLN